MRYIITLLLATCLLTSTAQTPDDCPAAQVWTGHSYQLTTEQLYVHSAGTQGYDVLPVWEQQTVRVEKVMCIEHKKGSTGIRVYVALEGGTVAYFEVAKAEEIGKFLQPLVALN